MQPIYSNNKASSNYLELMEVLITYFENMKNLKIHHLLKLLFKSFIFILSHKYANSLYQKYYFLKSKNTLVKSCHKPRESKLSVTYAI